MPSAFPTDLTDTLQVAVDAARAAGALIRDEFHRPGGPRGHGEHADIDAVAETTVRDALQAHRPDWGFVGEETARHAIDPQRPTWVVDPNDGTSAFLQGHRGSAVSIALIVKGVAVLGVVYAPTAPDDDGDLFAWAEGLPLTRNGVAVVRPALPTTLTPEGLVLLNASSADNALASAAFVAPARHRCVPSIAYRLALVAAGEADATVSTTDRCPGTSWADTPSCARWAPCSPTTKASPLTIVCGTAATCTAAVWRWRRRSRSAAV